MPLSRKHYQSIAAIFKAHSRRALNDAGDNGGADIWLSIRDDLTDYLASDNPNFDRDRFRRATEPDGKGEPDAPGEPAKLEPLTRTLTGLKQSIAEAAGPTKKSAAELLVEAYQRGEESEHIDWSDIDMAYEQAMIETGNLEPSGF